MLQRLSARVARLEAHANQDQEPRSIVVWLGADGVPEDLPEHLDGPVQVIYLPRSLRHLRRGCTSVPCGANGCQRRTQLRYASGVLRAAAGNHEAAIEELRGCDNPMFGGENPAMLPWRSAAALSLAELDRHDEARRLAADEVRRARSFGASRAIGIALRAQALVGTPAERLKRLAEALAVLEPSPARLEHARVLVDLGATSRAAGQRSAAREPLLEGLALAARCGAEPSSAGHGPSSRRSASGPEGPSTPVRTR